MAGMIATRRLPIAPWIGTVWDMPVHWQSSDDSAVLHTGDALAEMCKVPDGSIDLVWADPPFFLSKPGGTTCKSGRRVTSTKGAWDTPKDPSSLLEWHLRWMAEARRIMSPGATIFVCGSFHSIFATGHSLALLGFRILNNITWIKKSPNPNLGCRCFVHASESLIWASLGPKAKHYFDYQAMKAITGKQAKDVWTLGAPRKSEKLHGKHVTQKPIALIARCLIAALPDGGLVLDPFAGSGTTGVAVAQADPKRGWKYLGIEQEAPWNDVARKRILDERPEWK